MMSGKCAPVKAGRRPLSISFMQMVFEEYGFKSFLAMPAQPLSLLEWKAQQPRLPANSAGIGLVIDAGVHRFIENHSFGLTSLFKVWPHWSISFHHKEIGQLAGP